MGIEGQGHFFTIYFPGFVCFVLYYAKISGERLQDHWSSGLGLSFPVKIPLLTFIAIRSLLSDLGPFVCRRAVCSYAHAVWNRPWCALIGACAVSRTNTVFYFLFSFSFKRKGLSTSTPRHGNINGNDSTVPEIGTPDKQVCWPHGFLAPQIRVFCIFIHFNKAYLLSLYTF